MFTVRFKSIDSSIAAKTFVDNLFIGLERLRVEFKESIEDTLNLKLVILVKALIKVVFEFIV